MKGLSYAWLKLYKEAIQDFTFALQIDEKEDIVYYFRGRCNYLIEDHNAAFDDFQHYILNN